MKISKIEITRNSEWEPMILFRGLIDWSGLVDDKKHFELFEDMDTFFTVLGKEFYEQIIALKAEAALESEVE